MGFADERLILWTRWNGLDECADWEMKGKDSTSSLKLNGVSDEYDDWWRPIEIPRWMSRQRREYVVQRLEEIIKLDMT